MQKCAKLNNNIALKKSPRSKHPAKLKQRNVKIAGKSLTAHKQRRYSSACKSSRDSNCQSVLSTPLRWCMKQYCHILLYQLILTKEGLELSLDPRDVTNVTLNSFRVFSRLQKLLPLVWCNLDNHVWVLGWQHISWYIRYYTYIILHTLWMLKRMFLGFFFSEWTFFNSPSHN